MLWDCVGFERERERERKIQTRSSLLVIRKRFCAEEGLVPGGGIFVFY